MLSCAATVSTTTAPASICGVPVAATLSGDNLVITMGSLTVPAAGNVRFTGSKNVVFAVYGDVTIDGHLRVDAVGATSGAGARACSGANAGSAGGGGGGSHGSAGGQGGSAGGAANAVTSSNVHAVLERGCSGGTGRSNSGVSIGADGGGAGGALQISSGGTLTLGGSLSANGGGGQAGFDVGAGGGGSGGDVYLEAVRLLLGTGAAITAQGGGGATGDSFFPGADGSALPAVQADGDPSAAAFGGDGAGAAADGVLDPATRGGDEGSGGGAGIGRIGIDIADAAACTALPIARFSPQPTCQ